MPDADAPPEIRTPRLHLRFFRDTDAPLAQRYLSEWEVARPTAAIPHPYPPGGAAEWISLQAGRYAAGEALALAVTRGEDGALLGAVELRFGRGGHRGELGYWIARPFWGRGYATEAAGALVEWAFGTRRLHRVHAEAISANPASIAVLLRIGMRHEGTLRRHLFRWGALEDVELFARLAGDPAPLRTGAEPRERTRPGPRGRPGGG